MKVTQTQLEGCFIYEPSVFMDARGSFSETYNSNVFKSRTGVEINFVQDNQSVSKKHTLRGFHFQTEAFAQTKLVRVVRGVIIDVCVDLRPDSKTFLQHYKIKLSAENAKQLFIPKGFAHGFLVLEEDTIVSYKCDNYYDKQSERGIIYNDPTFGIDWDVDPQKLIISEKDLNLPSFEEYSKY